MYQQKNKRKNKHKSALSSIAAVLAGLVLVIVATAVFVVGFDRLGKKLPKVSVEKSSSVASSVKSSTSTAQNSTSPVKQSIDWQLVLVNYNNKMPDDFKNTIVREFNIDMDSRIVEPYRKMRDAALKEKVHIWISSGYRSYEKQGKLFADEIQTYKKKGFSNDDAVSKASKSVARPGYSEHNTGLAIDINGVLDSFDGTKGFQWMQEHAQEYGFILRFPKDKQDITEIKFEPWHYRYVGVENAKKMKKLNMCLEEYVDYLNENPDTSN
jgi:D-alanyl-D-alanine carboxypeptidase